jgi:hypothetical protein
MKRILIERNYIMSKVKNPNGYVVFEGVSLLDGAPIVVIAVGFNTASTNLKTGVMIQTYILRSDLKPNDAVKSGEDYSVCGDCPHRPVNNGSCYVRVFQGPRSVYESYKKGNYPKVEFNELPDLFAGHKVRLGSYGDPAVVPYAYLQAMIVKAVTHTGYTHQWERKDFDARVAGVCMASVDSADQYGKAQKLQYRTFRVRSDKEELLPNEVVCPASEEAGKKIDCATCGACKGADGQRKGSIAIIAHGGAKGRFFAARDGITERAERAFDKSFKKLNKKIERKVTKSLVGVNV